jgi:hypothetical protein
MVSSVMTLVLSPPFYVTVTPDGNSLQRCTPKVAAVQFKLFTACDPHLKLFKYQEIFFFAIYLPLKMFSRTLGGLCTPG